MAKIEVSNTQLSICFETFFLSFPNILLVRGFDALLSLYGFSDCMVLKIFSLLYFRVVKEEIIDEDTHLPCFNGRVVSWVSFVRCVVSVND